MDQEYTRKALKQGARLIAQYLPDDREAARKMCDYAMDLKDWEEEDDPKPKVSVVPR
jgi:hypothetical protein